MQYTVNLKDLRPRLPRVMEAVDGKMDRYVVTKRGHPMAVIISLDDYEGLLETVEFIAWLEFANPLAAHAASTPVSAYSFCLIQLSMTSATVSPS